MSIVFECELCNYTTNRKYNLKRHHNSVHELKNINKIIIAENNINVPENSTDIPEINTDVPENSTDIPENNNIINKKLFYCKKCNKKKLY